MMISGHTYTPNGMGAHDENGSVRCVCGLPEGAHGDSHFIVPVCGNCQREIDKNDHGWRHVCP